ncbi:diaminopropionate ammonia-lyase [Pedobacter sp. PAMC26386]|nr:diaminopropionate ammonia-lyase [Pedobacter sp. PAMC26386]
MLLINQNRHYGEELEAEYANIFSENSIAEVQQYLQARKDHKATPLHNMPALAQSLSIAGIFMKDEDYRLGLHSFKALGGAYAVIRLAVDEAELQTGKKNFNMDLKHPDLRRIAEKMTFACATDGNHGRSVAAGAQLIGARAVIFVHEGVSQKRRDEISKFGAEIIEVKGMYDDAVQEALRLSTINGWIVTSDTSWSGYERIPALVMQGYTALMQEALAQLSEMPSHIFIQAGVGGFAASVSGYLKVHYGDRQPKIIVVEPERAACLYESMSVGQAIKIEAGEPTVMAMLECYEPSLSAWRILLKTAAAFVTISEKEAIETMNLLARPLGNDPGIVSGESGGSGLAGLIHVCQDRTFKKALGVNEHSRILVINTEGATDYELYQQLVGLTPAEVYAKNHLHLN